MSSPRSSDSSRNQKSSSFPVRFAKSAFFQIFVFFTTVIVLGVAYASWTTLNVSQGADGQPVTQTLMQGIINNLNDINTRLAAVEAAQVASSGSGTLCGNSDWGAGAGNGIKCKGIAPIDGCPTGYTQGQFPIRAGGGIYGWAYTCIKN